MFNCDKCGLCCQNLNKSKNADNLNDGTGVCVYYDKKSKLCTIYNNRPPQCNVDYMYRKYFFKYMTLDEYYKINYDICKLLKKEEKERMF